MMVCIYFSRKLKFNRTHIISDAKFIAGKIRNFYKSPDICVRQNPLKDTKLFCSKNFKER